MNLHQVMNGVIDMAREVQRKSQISEKEQKCAYSHSES